MLCKSVSGNDMIVFWLISVAVILDIIILLAWRRKRGVSGRPEALLVRLNAFPHKLIGWWKQRVLPSRLVAWLSRLPTFPLEPVSPRIKKRGLLVFGLPLLLAAIPSWFVFEERWLFQENAYPSVRELICNIDFLCRLQFPSYFAFIIPIVLGLFYVAWRTRGQTPTLQTLSLDEVPIKAAKPDDQLPKLQSVLALAVVALALLGLIISALRAYGLFGSWPGMEYAGFYLLLLLGAGLWDTPVHRAGLWFRQHGLRVLSIIVAHLSLIWLLASMYNRQAAPWSALLVAAVAMLNVLRYRKEIGPVFWIISVALIVHTIHINAWWFSVIGDDLLFLREAREALASFSGNGYERFFQGGAHAYLSTLIQASFLALFGENSFAWRFSSIYPAIMSLPLFYGFFNYFLRKRVALLVTVLLAGSHYLMTFDKIGYNNLQALFVMGLMLYLTTRVIRYDRMSSYIFLGAAIGLSFYVFAGALLAVPLPLMLLMFYAPPRTWQSLKRWGAMALAALILIYPFVLQPVYWQYKHLGTFLTTQSVVTADNNAIWHVFSNFLYTLASPILVIDETHYLAVAYVDLISTVLLLIGVSYLAWHWQGQRFIRFLLVSFVFMVFVTGTIHNYLQPPTTRMFMLLPWFMFFVVVGLLWLGAQLQRIGFSTSAAGRTLLTVITLILIVNVYQAYVLSYQRSGRYHDFTTFLVGIGQEFFNGPQGQENRILVLNDATSAHVSLITGFLDLYQLPVDETNFVELRVFHRPGEEVLSFSEAAQLLENPEDLVVVNPTLADHAPEVLVLYEGLFQSQGRSVCDVNTSLGHFRFQLWYGTDRPQFCS